MCNDKNLSEEFRETVDETKAMLTAAIIQSSSVSGMDADDLVMSAKAYALINRLLGLSCDMFEKQDKLMDKMDKALDKYLKATNTK